MNETKDPKAEIVEAAFRTLKKQGLPHLSYEVVAREAGITRQAMRYHFPDSEGLMLAVCDYLAALYRDALLRGVAEKKGRARIEFFLDFYFDILSDNPKPRDDQAYDAVMSLAAGSPAIKAALHDQYGLLGQVVAIEVQLEFSTLSEADAKELSYLFVCLMYGHWKMVASLGFSEEHNAITRMAVLRLIDSYVAAGTEFLDREAWR